MPLTAAETKAKFEDTSINPKVYAQRKVVTLNLTFDGVEFDPKVLYEALDAKYGTVSSEKDTVRHGTYTLNIAP